MNGEPEPRKDDAAEVADGLRKRVLLGAAVLVLLLPPAISYWPQGARQAPPQAHTQVEARPPSQPHSEPLSHPQLQSPSRANSAAQSAPVVRAAQFATEQPSPDARSMANWVATSGDNQGRSFVIVDKKDAKVYVFDPGARLKASTPALLGAAVGDDSAPGIGDKPLAQVLPEEKTTPAGRFIAEVGRSTRGEDVVWVDYELAVSMHRVLNVPERLKSLASPTKDDNRMSFGCINLPPEFYEDVLRPTVDHGGAVIYVLPETRPLAATFASYRDVGAPLDVAQH